MSNNIALGITIGAALSGNFGSAFRSANQQANSLGRSLQQIRLGRTAAQDVGRLTTELTRLRAAQASAGTGDAALNRQIADTERQLNAARRSAERYGVNLGNLTGETNRLLHSEQRLGGALERTNRLRADSARRSELGSSMLKTSGLAIGAAFALAGPVKEAIEFESVMADIRKASDLAGEELKALGKEIIKTSTTMPMSTAGIGSIVKSGLQAGIAKNEILGFSHSAVKMGVAFDMGGEAAGETMVSWRAAMALTQKQANSLADAINHLDANMQGTAVAKDISEVVRRGGAFAQSAGLSEVKTAALSAAFLNPGTAPEVASTGMKNLLNALTKGKSAPKSLDKAFADIGMTPEKVASDMQKDAEKTIMAVLKAVAKSPAVNRPALVGNLFGEEGKLAIMPLIANLDATQMAFNLVGDASKYAGSMQKEYDIRSKTTENNAQLLSNKFDALKVNLGTALLPTLNTVFGVMGNISMKMSGFAETFPRVTEAVVGLSFGLIGLKLGSLAAAWTGTILSSAWVYARIAGINLMTVAQWGWNAAVSFGLWPLALIGAAVVGTAFLIYRYWGPLSTFFSETFTQISTTAIGWKNEIVGVFTSVVDYVKPIWESFIGWLSEKMAWIGQIIEKFKSIGATIGNAVGSVFSGAEASQAGTRASLGDFGRSPATASLPAVASANSAPVNGGNISNVFHITQKPGEDSKDLAERVAKHISRQKEADRRGALHD